MNGRIVLECMTRPVIDPRREVWLAQLSAKAQTPDEIVCVELRYPDGTTCWVGKRELQTNRAPGCYVVSDRRKTGNNQSQ